MNKKAKIVYTPMFYNDFKSIIDYIKNKLMNPKAANRIIDEVMSSIEKRSYNPVSFEQYYSLRKRKIIYYRINVNNFIVFYVMKDNVMEVRRILFNKMNFDNKL